MRAYSHPTLPHLAFVGPNWAAIFVQGADEYHYIVDGTGYTRRRAAIHPLELGPATLQVAGWRSVQSPHCSPRVVRALDSVRAAAGVPTALVTRVRPHPHRLRATHVRPPHSA